MSLKTRAKPLTESEELLLVKYIDNECGFFNRLFAKRLIKSNPQAEQFVNSLNILSDEFSSTQYALKDMSVNLWDKISQRIDQEEKAEFYLGRRTDVSAEKVPVYDWAKLNWGLGSGLAAAGLALFFTYSGMAGSSIPGTESSIGNSTLASALPNRGGQISLVSSQSRSKPDWIKSHGKVRMIKDSAASVPIIWVNRSLSSYGNQSRVLRAPNHSLFDLEDNRAKTPIIMEDKVPNALSVSGSNGAFLRERGSFKSKQ